MNNKIKILIAAGLVVGLGWLFLNKPQPEVPNPNGQVTALSAIEFAAVAEQPETFVLDVHIPEQQHLTGTDAFIPYNELKRNLDQLPADKNTPIAIYCRSGSMSREASQTLIELGYAQVYDLVGGISAYKAAFGEIK